MLVGSRLGPAQFGSPVDVADNVALHAFTITTADPDDLTRTGVSVGGIDPCVTIFCGLGAGATFLASNFVNAFRVGGDSAVPLLLAAGDCTLAVGALANMVVAEDRGVGHPARRLHEPRLAGQCGRWALRDHARCRPVPPSWTIGTSRGPPDHSQARGDPGTGGERAGRAWTA